MSLVSYLVVALAFGITMMLAMRLSAGASPVRLSRGLFASFVVGAVQGLLLYVGCVVGNLLRFEAGGSAEPFADINAWMLFWLVVFVAVRQAWPYLRREPQLTAFAIDGVGRVLLMAVATGINVLLVGIGFGFADSAPRLHACLWPMLAFVGLLGFVGVMFGRRGVALRPRRWALVSSVLLLGVALAAVVFA